MFYTETVYGKDRTIYLADNGPTAVVVDGSGYFLMP
jgi:hypothetical protein